MNEELKAVIFDGLTGEVTKRPLTAEEVIQSELIKAGAEAAQAEQAAKIASRESALAKLAALGLTEDEIAAL
jgi:DNA-binding NarL/FixJ family response regulator